MDIKVIKTPADYERMLGEVERLVLIAPAKGSADSHRLELLAALVQKYEEEHFPIPAPTPLEALEFRMESQGLTPRDLEPFIGSRSKVSEVLSGKVPLSLRMIRALSAGLDIPAQILIGDSIPHDTRRIPRLPVKELARRGWISQKATDNAAAFASLVEAAGGRQNATAFLRRSTHIRGSRSFDPGAQLAWTLRVLHMARGASASTYAPATLTAESLRQLVQLSSSADGPLRARRFLADIGIAFVVLPHLPRTRLDGAALLSEEERPVIAMTLRLDRIDNFWFTLVHELIHVRDHLSVVGTAFLDDLDVAPADDVENETDAATADILVPTARWTRCRARQERTPAAVLALAQELRIHPAIVAGMVRHDADNYRLLAQFLGQGEVRRLFEH
jgi:HTH-type transcriptional regulator / antitoxin HigA